MSIDLRRVAGLCGLMTIGLFSISYGVFSWLNPSFDTLHDFVSKLGAVGEPLAFYWNLIGFGAVGISFALFGLLFGTVIRDHLAGICLLVSGIGFAMAASPTELDGLDSPLSRVHYASICLALAGWCLALARLSYVELMDETLRPLANVAAVLAIVPMLAMAGEISSEPIAHRWVLLVVGSWVTAVSIRLLKARPQVARGVV